MINHNVRIIEDPDSGTFKIADVATLKDNSWEDGSVRHLEALIKNDKLQEQPKDFNKV